MSLAGTFWSLYLGTAQQPQEQCCPFLTVCALFSCVQTMVWLPVFRIFNLRTESPAGNPTWGLHGHRRRVGTECRLWEKNPLPHKGLEPASISCLGVAVRRSTSRAVPVPPILPPWQRSRLTYAARRNDLTLAPLILCHRGPLCVSRCSHMQISCLRTCFVVFRCTQCATNTILSQLS